MRTLNITITGSQPNLAGALWTNIEQVIGAVTGEVGGRLTRITRPDGQANYRAHGRYEMTFRGVDETFAVTLDLQ